MYCTSRGKAGFELWAVTMLMLFLEEPARNSRNDSHLLRPCHVQGVEHVDLGNANHMRAGSIFIQRELRFGEVKKIVPGHT